jgi:hypothetical protein
MLIRLLSLLKMMIVVTVKCGTAIRSLLNGWLVGFMELNAIFNNISVISWRSVLLVEKTGGPGENHRPVASQPMKF